MKGIAVVLLFLLLTLPSRGQENPIRYGYHPLVVKSTLFPSSIPHSPSDSIQNDKETRNFWLGLFTGNYWQNKKGNAGFGYEGLINPQCLTFNTVDGWIYRQSIAFNVMPDSTRHFSFNQDISYAFNRKAWMGLSRITYYYLHEQHGKFTIAAQTGSADYNGNNGIDPYINSITSLFFRRNHMKLFDKTTVHINNAINVNRNLNLTLQASYLQANTLENHSDYSFFYRKTRDYTTNIPENTNFTFNQNNPFKSFTLMAELAYTPQNYYKYTDRHNILIYSQSPTLTLNFKVALPTLFQSDASYQFLAGGISQQLHLTKNSKFFYEIRGGSFLNVKKIHFSEFQHFNTQPLAVVITDFDNSFQLLDYYKFSTSHYFMEGHLKYSTMYFFLKYLPWIRDHFWTENLYLNYLNTPTLKHYTELGYGLGQLIFLFNLDVFVSFESGTYQAVGLKLCIGRY